MPSKAQARYRRRRKKCRPHKLLENPELFALVKKLFLGCHWSPEQIAERLKLEGRANISYKTIYRAIYASMFDTPEQKRSEGNRGAIRKLRHRGKPRRPKDYVSNRGKIPISHELSERPRRTNAIALAIGKLISSSALIVSRVCLVDRRSRFLICKNQCSQTFE